MKKKNILLGVFIVIAALITIMLYTLSKSTGSIDQQFTQSNLDFIKFQAESDHIVNTIEVKGKSAYVKENWVYAPFSADVKTWHVIDGMQVEKGDVLFELADEKLRENMALLQANVRKQELTLKLNEMRTSVATDNAISNPVHSDLESVIMNQAFDRYAKDKLQSMQLEIDQLQYDVAAKELADTEHKLTMASYTAEESGIFLFLDTNVPDRVNEDVPVGKIVDTSKLQLITTVGEFEVFHINEGMDVTIRAEALKNTLIQGKVEHVSKFAKPGTEQNTGPAQFEVIISLEADELLIAGLSLTGKIQTDIREDATVIPTLAILRDQDEYYVFVERDGAIEKQTIIIGLETPDKTEVLEGIEIGDTIVLQ